MGTTTSLEQLFHGLLLLLATTPAVFLLLGAGLRDCRRLRGGRHRPAEKLSLVPPAFFGALGRADRLALRGGGEPC